MDLSHPLLAAADQDLPPFPPNYPQLSRLDTAVTCQICKELFTGPVSIACGHSFCSLCIRGSFDVMKKCPSCNEPATEGSIRRNRALEEITDAWEAARTTLITLTRPTPTHRKRPGPEPNSKASSSTSVAKRPRRGSRSPSKGLPVPDGDEVEVPSSDEIGELDERDCPICGARLPIASIPLHIERGCPKPKSSLASVSGNQKADWKRVFAGAGGKEKEIDMKRIKKPNYAMITPGELRNLLSEYALPTTGDKAILMTRLQEWTVLFNANLDTSHPKSLSALRAQLNDAEMARRRDRERGKEDAVRELATKEGFEKYGREKKGEFERLRKEIQERDKRRGGNGKENAIEIE